MTPVETVHAAEFQVVRAADVALVAQAYPGQADGQAVFDDLAHAARELAAAVDRLPAGDRPRDWAARTETGRDTRPLPAEPEDGAYVMVRRATTAGVPYVELHRREGHVWLLLSDGRRAFAEYVPWSTLVARDVDHAPVRMSVAQVTAVRAQTEPGTP